MAVDFEHHSIDPVTGFAVGRDGHVVGLTPPSALPPSGFSEFPKYVLCHESHVVRLDGKSPVVSLFPDFHVNRANGEVTVLVRDEAEEKMAMSEKEQAPSEVGQFYEIGAPESHDPTPALISGPSAESSDAPQSSAEALAELEKSNPELAAKLKASLANNGANA